MAKFIILLSLISFGTCATILPSAQDNIRELLIPQSQEFLRLPNATTEKVGRYTNVRIGSDGHPIIAFNDEAERGIRVVHFKDFAYKKMTSDVIDARPGLGDNGRFIRMEINPINTLPYFTYISSDNRATMMAFCTDNACHNVVTKKIYGGNSSHPSIAFRYDNGWPIIAYKTKSGLQVALCRDLNCSTIKTIKITNKTGLSEMGDYVHVEVGIDNIPVFSWYDLKTHVIKYGRCSDKYCSVFDIVTIDSSSDVGKYNFMRLDSLGNAIILYADVTNGYLKTAYCSDYKCRTPIISIVDNNIGAGKLVYGVFPEININPKTGMPIMSYVAQPNADDGSAQGILKIAQCEKRDCSKFLVQEVARGGLGYGRDTSMAFKDNLIYLTFLDYNNNAKRAYVAILKQQ